MRILVADDDALFHRIADAILPASEYEVVHARDGLQALTLFKDCRPDLVLTDYQMPGMNGIELCRSIKAFEPERFVPLVMLTGAGENQLLRESLEVGVVEFLTKPVVPEELRLRVRSLGELITLHSNLALAKTESDEEMLLTKHVLFRLVEPGLKAMPPFIHMETLQTRRINGDACTYSQGIPGVHFGFLCDATGHGLTAGISTIPAIQAFLSMVSRDIPLEIIYREINTKLRQMLPSGRFVCLMLIRLDLHAGTLSVLNAGLPDALLTTQKGISRRFASRNLPASVLDVVDEPVIEEVAVSGGERFLAFTDGIQEVLGEQDAYRILLEGMATTPFNVHRTAIQECLQLDVNNQEHLDDVSWALWEVPRPEQVAVSAAPSDLGPFSGPMDTTFAVELAINPRLHSTRELLPDCLRLLCGQGVPHSTEQSLAITLTEALTNAVDHGMLQLDSRVKEEGFETYEALRKERLAAAGTGTITLRIRLLSGPGRAVQTVGVEVEDPGSGFDWRAREGHQAWDSSHASGRGLLIIRSLASDMSFNESGNCLRFTLPCG